MVGIGGIGMQALADVLLGMEHKITGSNLIDFPERGRLEAKGIVVTIGQHKPENVPEDIDELIYTSAIKRYYPNDDHPEVVRARQLGVEINKRSEFIGKLMQDKIGIAVSGTHGKTTTTTLITLMLQIGGLDPTALIGAEVKSLQGGGFLGKGPYMVVEACEYDRSFLDMKPKIAVLTNIEADHLDYYEDIQEIKEAFAQFLELVPVDGLIIANGDDENIKDILPRAKAKVITFGFGPHNDVRATELKISNPKMSFKVGNFETYINFPGRHLVLDALSAIAVARHLKIKDADIHQALVQFKGAKRRFEMLGDYKGVAFVDDYAHHPTEIKAMLKSTRDYFGNRKIRVVFQPHQFSRTRFLLDEFANSFKDADEVLIAPILPVRDTPEEQKLINSQKLVDEINQISGNAKNMPSFDAVTDYLNKVLKSDEVVLSLGAGQNSEWIHAFLGVFKNQTGG